MLCLTRFTNQTIYIGESIVITVNKVKPNGQVMLGIHAPEEVKILRGELLDGTKGINGVRFTEAEIVERANAETERPGEQEKPAA
jgi:carbon storage regulator CsrA